MAILMLNNGWDSDHSEFQARRRARVEARGRYSDRLAVLLVEEDTDVASGLADALVGQPVEVFRCADGATALFQIGRMCPDAVVLGPTSSRLDATEFLSVLRELEPDLPIVVGAGAGSGDLANRATELGATAVVRRPYAARELLAMIRSFSPRPDEVELRPMVIDLGRLKIDGAQPQFWLDDVAQQLPPQEFILLRYFAERVGAALTRTELNRAIWGDKLGVRSNSLTVHVARLRKRLGDNEHDPQWIKVIRGVGYQFIVPERTEPAVPVQPGPGDDPQ